MIAELDKGNIVKRISIKPKQFELLAFLVSEHKHVMAGAVNDGCIEFITDLEEARTFEQDLDELFNNNVTVEVAIEDGKQNDVEWFSSDVSQHG